MTIGPEPITSTRWMSVRLGICSMKSARRCLRNPHVACRLSTLLDLVEELPEQVVGVVWARRRFRMVLHAEHRPLAMTQAFDRLVVQVDVRDLDVGRQRRRLDGEAVV